MQDQSPSFNSYSCDSLADIADKVSHEFRNLHLHSPDSALTGDDEFEFASPAASADGVFLNGTAQIRPVFPVFNRDLLGIRTDGDRPDLRGGDDDEASDPPSSCSSEADELEGIPEATYCVWKPASTPATPSREFRRKSRSTGSTSSKRWRFLDLLRRSNSDGKDSFVFLTPSPSKSSSEAKLSTAKVKPSGVDPAARKGKTVAAAHEVFYARHGAVAERRRSTSLPYKNGWFGFPASVNTMGRTFPPF